MAYTTIDDPSEYFQIALYTGNETSRSITNTGNSDLKPDWVWIKERNNAISHRIFDSSRGATKRIFTNNSDAESTQSNSLTAFNTDGFSLGDGTSVNGNSDTYVAWQWKANGGTTSSNSDGSITSTVQANTTAGFSIVTYTGTGSNATVGHGMSIAPTTLIIKRRDGADDWLVLPPNQPTKALNLNSTGAIQTYTPYFNDTAPTSTVFSLGDDGRTNGSSETYVAYCFAPIQGYSKFGSFVGNNSSDGTFVYLGFTPRWLMVKNTTQSHANHSWIIFDSARETNNVIDTFLEADTIVTGKPK